MLKTLSLAVAVLAVCCSAGHGAPKRISVLFGMTTKPALTALPTGLEPQLRQELLRSGLDVQWDKCDYKDFTPERLSRFNAVVMTYPPALGNNASVAVYRSKMDMVLDYVKSGGGLIIMNDEDYDSYKSLNEFLAKLDAQVVPENPVDPATLYHQPSYLQHYYCSTQNIHAHPVSEGVKSVWYPLAYNPDLGKATFILKLGAQWTPIVCANPGAYYYATKPGEEDKRVHDTPQPILAARDLGSGRIVAFATRTLNFFHQPHNPLFGGICIERGDGLQLVRNMLDWTSQPAVTAGRPGGFVMPKPAPVKTIDAAKLAGLDYYQRVRAITGKGPQVLPDTYSGPYSDGLRDFTGVIGAHTTYSQAPGDTYFTPGRGTVKEYCDAAKKCGLGFVVFTELFENMNAEKWAKLRADCSSETTGSFAAIPGIQIQDSLLDTYIVIDMPRWPDPDSLDKAGKRITDSPAFYFGLARKFDQFVGRFLLNPRGSSAYPWETKFYSGFPLFSFRRGSDLVSQAVDYYMHCQSNDYNLLPMTTQGLWTPLEVYNCKGMLTHVRAAKAQDIASQFQYRWYAERKLYVSSGPKLTQWTMQDGRWSIREQEWRARIGVKSGVPLKSVTIYDRGKVFRRFFPHSKVFGATLAGYHDKQRFLVPVAEDVEGRKLIGPALYTSDLRQSQYMCTDLQNTINCSRDIAPDGGELIYPGSVGNGVTEWDGVTMKVASADVIPDSGIEFAYGGWNLTSSAHLPSLDGDCYAVGRREMPFSTGDCNIMRDVFDSTLVNNFPSVAPSLATIADHIGYTARLNGINVQCVRHRTRLLRDYSLPQGSKSVWLRCMHVDLAAGKYPNYVLVDGHGRKTQGFRSANLSLDVTLKPRGYFAAFPDLWGSFCIMPWDKPIHLQIRGDSVEVGYDITGSLKAGTTFKTNVIYVCGKYGSPDEKDFDSFRTAFGLAGPPAYKYQVTAGTLLSTRYVFSMKAQGYWAAGEISRARMGSNLPINVAGLNEKWDAGLLDLDSRELRRIGVHGNTGVLTRNIDNRRLRFACGNLVTCGDPGIFLSIFNRAGKWSVEAHNPTGKPVVTRIRTAPWLRGVAPELDRQVTIPAGSTVILRLGKT